MSCCNPYNIGLVPHNEDIWVGGLLAEVAGIYTFRLWFGPSAKDITSEIGAGDRLIMPIVDGDLNENYVYELQVFLPDGDELFPPEGECWIFQTFIKRNNACDSEPIPPYSSY